MRLRRKIYILLAIIVPFLFVLGVLYFNSGEKRNIKARIEQSEEVEVKEGVYEGKLLPDFLLKDLRGEDVTLKEFKGKAVLLNFWATWCSPCRKEIPSMVKLYREYKDKGLEVLSVNLDKMDKAGVEKFALEYGINFPVLLDPKGEVALRFGIVALPTTFILDREGRIRERVAGSLNWVSEENLKKFETLLSQIE